MQNSENTVMYSLERISAAALALYNFSREHLESQTLPQPDALHTIIPAVSDITYEMRAISGHDPRLRELWEIAPSFSRTSSMYWAPSRDDRDGRRIEDEKSRHSPQNKPTHRLPRMRSADDSRMSSDSYDMSFENPQRTDSVVYVPYSQTMPQRPSADQSLPYVPKYRKRSRAPAPGVCQSCGNNETPEWRRGPDGARTLCNACGLHFAKLVRRRSMQYADAPEGTPIPPVTIAELRASINGGSDGARAPQRRGTDTPAPVKDETQHADGDQSVNIVVAPPVHSGEPQPPAPSEVITTPTTSTTITTTHTP
ncbi:hypothetical protein MCUN1_000964 [Malassezia cuniculi]|uniref:GATA-type domain-containing protein n=1 Tax=Malassezia cuniculi TaxID=948313 RepID=A0AAF0ESW7_9BASI|nr:hypothetical protein MCUN1_000964 [Malassezia cuniculi]